MREIKHLMKDMNCNIEEACEKIKKAYRLREENRAVADWQRDMAKAHMEFNIKAHEIATKMISEASTEKKDNPMTTGMIAVYKDWHADIVAKAAEVSAMISAYK